jgi:hypothetical protein
MSTEDKKDDDLLKVIENGDGSVTVGGDEVVTTSTEAAADDTTAGERQAAGSEDNEDYGEHGDDNADAGPADETPEARAARRREERKQSKERRKSYIDGLKNELAMTKRAMQEMQQRVEVIDRRSTGAEIAHLENSEREAKMLYERFKDEHSRAVESADGEAATEAQERMLACRQRLAQINNIKQNYQRSQSTPPPLDPRLKGHAERWMSENTWFDPATNDNDTRITRTLDDGLAQEGYDPTTQEYWEELDRRISKYLPHRTKSRYSGTRNGSGSEDTHQTGGRSTVAGSGRETSSNGGGANTGYRLSAERVKALKEAGMWDDPKQRASMIRRYQEQDRQQAAGN